MVPEGENGGSAANYDGDGAFGDTGYFFFVNLSKASGLLGGGKDEVGGRGEGVTYTAAVARAPSQVLSALWEISTR